MLILKQNKPNSQLAVVIPVLSFLAIIALIFGMGLSTIYHIKHLSAPRLEAHQSIIETTQDKKYYFVTYVGSQGVDLAPCVGSGCEPQGWSAKRLQATPHHHFHYGYAGYDEALSMFTRQTIPLCDDGSKPSDEEACADGTLAIR